MMQNNELQDKSVPPEFHESNNKKKNRSIRLAEEARDTLVEFGLVPCTEKEFLEATKNAAYSGEIAHLFRNDAAQ